MIDRHSALWSYFTDSQKRLAAVGEFLINDRRQHPSVDLSDYSYIVFPFAKLYEGFLKHVFRDLKIISEDRYRDTHYRIGKALSPGLVEKLGKRSAYGHIQKQFSKELATKLWKTWKEGRNVIFHYYPGNVQALSEKEAIDKVYMIIDAMGSIIEASGLSNHDRLKREQSQ